MVNHLSIYLCSSGVNLISQLKCNCDASSCDSPPRNGLFALHASSVYLNLVQWYRQIHGEVCHFKQFTHAAANKDLKSNFETYTFTDKQLVVSADICNLPDTVKCIQYMHLMLLLVSQSPATY